MHKEENDMQKNMCKMEDNLWRLSLCKPSHAYITKSQTVLKVLEIAVAEKLSMSDFHSVSEYYRDFIYKIGAEWEQERQTDFKQSKQRRFFLIDVQKLTRAFLKS